MRMGSCLKVPTNVTPTIHVRHVDIQFDEIGEVCVIRASVADLSGEGFCSNSSWDAGLAHTCKQVRSAQPIPLVLLHV